MGIEVIYWACFAISLGYGACGLFGEFLGGAEASQHALIAGHDPGAGLPSEAPLLNSLTLTSFLLSFGALGLLGVYGLGLEPLVSLLFAISSGIILAAFFFLAFVRTVYRSQSSSSPRLSEVMSSSALTTVSIPAEGTGEIAYVAGGSRFTMPAREERGKAIAKGQRVAIVRVEKGVAYVASVEDRLPPAGVD